MAGAAWLRFNDGECILEATRGPGTTESNGMILTGTVSDEALLIE